MIFDSRQRAGQLLAEELRKRNIRPDLVYGLARGGVVVAAEIAAAFKAPLEPLIVRKISPPENPEFALGAIAGIPGSDPSAVRSVAKDGSEPSKISVWWDGDTVRRLGLSAEWQKRQIRDKEIEISNYSSQISFTEKVARSGSKLSNIVLVDDGAATGATMLAAIGAVRKASQGLSLAYLPAEERAMSRERIIPRGEWQAKVGAKESPYKTKVIVSLPVASIDAAAKIQPEADKTAILSVNPDFRAVGQYYRSFEQISWEEVREILKASRGRTE